MSSQSIFGLATVHLPKQLCCCSSIPTCMLSGPCEEDLFKLTFPHLWSQSYIFTACKHCVIISREQCFSTWNIKLESFEKVLGPVSYLIYVRNGDVMGLECGLGSRIAIETPQLILVRFHA